MNRTNDDSSDWYNPRIQSRALLGREVNSAVPLMYKADGWSRKNGGIDKSIYPRVTHDTHATTIAWTGCELRPTDGSCLWEICVPLVMSKTETRFSSSTPPGLTECQTFRAFPLNIRIQHSSQRCLLSRVRLLSSRWTSELSLDELTRRCTRTNDQQKQGGTW